MRTRRTDERKLVSTVEQLRAERDRSARRVEEIDATFRKLGITMEGQQRAKITPVQNEPGRRGKRRPRGVNQDLLLGVIKGFGKRGATTHQIVEEWKRSGRDDPPHGILSNLVKQGKLQKNQNKSRRGSRYTVA